jgi:hypothetical protein
MDFDAQKPDYRQVSAFTSQEEGGCWHDACMQLPPPVVEF